jgi:hypothetical protein
VNKSEKRQWVSASDVGRASFCPHYLELNRKGAQPSREAVVARKRGEERHNELNRQAEDRRCYVATYLYGADHPKTQLLRSYRDRELLSTSLGRMLVRLYYLVSPAMILASRVSPFLRRHIESLVDWKVNNINGGDDYE